jgi:hypothetical protein
MRMAGSLLRGSADPDRHGLTGGRTKAGKTRKKKGQQAMHRQGPEGWL